MKHTAKRRAYLALTCLLALVTAMVLGGCSNPSDQERIAELEAQVQDLQSQKDSNSNATQSDTNANTKDSQAHDQTVSNQSTQTVTPPAADTNVIANYPDVSSFEARTAELEDACAAVIRSKDANANYQAYLDMKLKLDQFDNEMDAYDEQQENAARQGTISYNDYIQIETALDRLSDRLDYAEDSMQYKLGIYDD